jgi:hypothetical protein
MIFRAYNVVISIMRAELAIPLGLREDMIAQGMEREALRQQLRRKTIRSKRSSQRFPQSTLSRN